ncbi:quinol dehydrogenase membrane component [Hartmannibacter diazotrophicus]|uniref:Quinol dehydrogenase membrane component n=1 Tax=Hartmannibacter diazotrophicus TaxID=1482074 RepID=A0A2C9DDH9_9HYPH|nr:cytochrome c oxidase accessory protein CcoG [Hartmannibacter diazotrophicus]SON58303.1 quinol dehydrogenase membrane component [Hartmannibacter diazotrophicus]
MNVHNNEHPDEEVLYASARKIYPQSVKGRQRTIKWAVLFITLGIYYFLPFVRWDRGPNAPDQAVLVDMAGRRAYFFFIEIWPQEVYYLTGLLILAALALFLMNALAGRVWCGYLCPQTVWTDLFLYVESKIEGDRRARMLLDKAPWTASKIAKRAAKHVSWLMIAWWTGGAWVLYFADAPTLVKDLATGQAPVSAYLWIAILTFTTYALAGHMREQVCLYMCPWPRIQAALTDEWALNVTYRTDRGEPRMSAKRADKARAAGEPAGDCVDCNQCVVVCPTGVDIREGVQLGCIQCSLCIDACDNVMAKLGREEGLIAYDTDMNIERRAQGLNPIYRLVRPRTVLYAAVIAIVGSVMLYALATRSFVGINVLHDRNPIFVNLSDGGVRNGYTIRILNKRPLQRDFLLSVSGLPTDTKVEAVGSSISVGGWPVVSVKPDSTEEVRVLLITAPDAKLHKSTDITFHVIDSASGERAAAGDFFRTR